MRTLTKGRGRRSGRVLALCFTIAVVGCGKSKTAGTEGSSSPPEASAAEKPTPSAEEQSNGAGESAAQKKQPPVTSNPADRLASALSAEPPTSHSVAVVDVFMAAGEANHAVLVLGRKHATLNGKVVGKMRCLHKGRPCTAAQRMGPVSTAAIDVDPADLEAVQGEVVIAAARKAAAALKDVAVAVVADRRVRASAVRVAVASLQAGGARPILGALNGDGKVVLVARQEGGPAGPVQRTHEAIGLPDAVLEIRLEVSDGKMQAVLHVDPGGMNDVRNGLHGDRATAVARWADRIADAYPKNNRAVLAVDDNMPYVDVVELLDQLRDSCGKGSTRGRCKARARRFEIVALAKANPPPAVAAPKPIPKAPPGALSAEILTGIGDHRARIAPPVPVPHELLQGSAMPPQALKHLPSRPDMARPNLGGPPQSP